MDVDSKTLTDGYMKSCNNDLEIIELILNSGSKNVLIFYHIQQAFEKFLKADLINLSRKDLDFVEIKKNLGHKTEDLAFNLLIELCDIYKEAYSRINSIVNTQVYWDFIEQMNSFNVTFRTKSNEINKDYVKNIFRYKDFVTEIYSQYEKSKNSQVLLKQKPLLIITICFYLSCCLYKMNNISRYPEKEFE